MSIADTIVPWTAEWLVHYEIWLMTGEWYGGGDCPPRRAGTTGLPSVGRPRSRRPRRPNEATGWPDPAPMPGDLIKRGSLANLGAP
jgi:hypothetical protein